MANPRVDFYGANRGNYGVGRSGNKVEFIQIHYTGNMGAAWNNCNFFHNTVVGASAHYFVDGFGTIWQSVLEKDTAWAGGNLDINKRSICIEVVSDGRDFSKSEIDELAVLVQDLMKRYNIPKSRVIRHYDVVDVATIGITTDPHKHCPAPYINEKKWKALRDIITGENKVDKYSQIEVDGVMGPQSVIALQRVLGVHPSGIIQGQGKGWKAHHKGISNSCIEYHESDSDVKGCDVIAALQRVCGKNYLDRSGVLTKYTISKWQEQRGMTPDGYFGPVTAKVTQRWINKWLKEYKIKL